jgi:hypothetical protein
MKAENPQLNVSEVSFAHRKAGNNSFGKRSSYGISNVSNAAVDDRFFEKHEYHALIPEQKNTMRFKRPKRGHVGNIHGGNGNGTGKGNGKGPTIKSITRSIAALATKFDKFSLSDDDDDESSEEEEGTSNRSNTVTGWDPEGETQSLRIVSAALGYTIPESGKTVLLIVHHRIFSTTLKHNLLSTIQLRLHDVIVNETPKFQCLKPTNLSHSISVRGDNVDDVLVIPLDLHGVVSCFPTFKPSQK